MPRAITIWGLAILLYAVFFTWYTSFEGPLTAEEIDSYVSIFVQNGTSDAQGAELLRTFLEEDTGGDFVMVNAILMRERPLPEPGVRPDETSGEVLNRYMAYMWPALLQRACHPVLLGQAVAPAMDVWGIENGERWTTAGLMRYRSRRDLMEIASNPDFNGPHAFKIAAMEKTIAFPVETMLNLGDPRLLFGLLLFGLAAFGHLIALLRRTVESTSDLAEPTPPPGWDA